MPDWLKHRKEKLQPIIWVILIGFGLSFIFGPSASGTEATNNNISFFDFYIAPIPNYFLNGLLLGGIYALIAVGYTMVYGIIQLINFAHGEIFMMGTYFAFVLVNQPYSIPFWGAFILAILGAGLLGVFIEYIAYRPLRFAPRLSALITAIGISLMLQNIALYIWGGKKKQYAEDLIPDYFTSLPVSTEILKTKSLWVQFTEYHKIYLGFGDLTITVLELFIILTTVLMMVGLWVIVKRTSLGRAMRACAEDKDAASLMGVEVNHVISMTFAIGSIMGAVAGILVGLQYKDINPMMGYQAGIKAFAAAVFGGIGNIPGAFLGGILLGIGESFGAGYISAGYRHGIAYALMIIVIIFKPTGLLGKKEQKKV